MTPAQDIYIWAELRNRLNNDRADLWNKQERLLSLEETSEVNVEIDGLQHKIDYITARCAYYTKQILGAEKELKIVK